MHLGKVPDLNVTLIPRCAVRHLLHLLVLEQLISAASEIISACSKRDHVPRRFRGSATSADVRQLRSWGQLQPGTWLPKARREQPLSPALQPQIPTESCCPSSGASKLTALSSVNLRVSQAPLLPRVSWRAPAGAARSLARPLRPRASQPQQHSGTPPFATHRGDFRHACLLHDIPVARVLARVAGDADAFGGGRQRLPAATLGESPLCCSRPGCDSTGSNSLLKWSKKRRK